MFSPGSLHKGDKIAIISPSGVIEREYVEKASELLHSWGLEVVWGENVFAHYGRFAGTDVQRLQDLQQALDDKEIKAVLCSRGGYGVVHLINKISFRKFKQNPKWIIGYSDITALHACIQKIGFSSLHAPMCKHLAEEENDASSAFLKNLLFGKYPSYHVSSHLFNKKGKSTGVICGGNLSVLSGIRGTSFDPVKKGNILFIEDIGEKPYHVERMMYNLKLGNVLKRISGLIVGQFSEYEEDVMMNKSLYQSILDLVSDYDYPVCFNFPVGHVKDNFPVICGNNATLTVNKDEVTLSFNK